MRDVECAQFYPKDIMVNYNEIPGTHIIIHLMAGPEGNIEFCFPRISMFPEAKSREGNIDIRGKQNSLFPKGPVIK